MTFQHPITVACVGDSITYGTGIAEREQNSYPAQLQQQLDAVSPGRYLIANFGRPARTLMSNTAPPYRSRLRITIYS